MASRSTAPTLSEPRHHVRQEDHPQRSRSRYWARSHSQPAQLRRGAQPPSRSATRCAAVTSFCGGPLRPSPSVSVKAGTVLRLVNNDIMPHKLIQTAGPKLHPVGANMNHTSASTSVKLMRKGLYRFTTKAGEDYASMSMMKTVGEDYVLHLRVRVK